MGNFIFCAVFYIFWKELLGGVFKTVKAPKICIDLYSLENFTTKLFSYFFETFQVFSEEMQPIILIEKVFSSTDVFLIIFQKFFKTAN